MFSETWFRNCGGGKVSNNFPTSNLSEFILFIFIVLAIMFISESIIYGTFSLISFLLSWGH